MNLNYTYLNNLVHNILVKKIIPCYNYNYIYVPVGAFHRYYKKMLLLTKCRNNSYDDSSTENKLINVIKYVKY